MKTGTLKKTLTALFAVVFVASLAVPAVSFGSSDDPSASDASNGASNVATSGATADASSPDDSFHIVDNNGTQVVEPADGTGGADAAAANGAAATQPTPADDCTVTLEYWENVTYDDPATPPNASGRYKLGTRVLTGLHEGDVLDTWDYVVELPGYFFFDAWPAELTVSTDPSQNVIELFYMRLWDSSFTVNYYLMEGANLAADNWHDALDTGDVTFTKMGSEVVENQPSYELVDGDAYEYQLDGTYVIDTYPAQIRLGADTDNNVINVLYTPTTTHLPDSVEIPDAVLGDVSGDAGGSGSGDAGSGDATLPDDTVIEDVEEVLPDDLINAGNGVEITDEMLQNPVPKAEAERISEAYRAGVQQGAGLAQTGDDTAVGVLVAVAVACGCIAVVALIALAARRKKRAVQEQQGQQE